MDPDCRIVIESVFDAMGRDTGQQGDRSTSTHTVFADLALVQKIIHACFEAKALADIEHHQIVEAFLTRTITSHELSAHEGSGVGPPPWSNRRIQNG